MGTPDFAVPALEAIVRSGHKIAGVVSQPDKPKGRGLRLLPSPVKSAALQHNISPILQPPKLKDPEFLQKLEKLHADVFVVVAFRILPEAVFSLPAYGTLNIHPSLLPKYRGAAPIPWSIINGDKQTGVSIIEINEKIDAGKILRQQTEPIHHNDTAGDLHDRLSDIGARLLVETLDDIAAGRKQQPLVQNDLEATPAPKITRETCHLSFEQPVEHVRNHIRGLSPYPAAFVLYQGKNIKLFRAEEVSSGAADAAPGTIVAAAGDHFHIACTDGVIAILELQMEGKRRMSTAEFLRGFSLQEGEILC